jgi:hypothetical protein
MIFRSLEIPGDFRLDTPVTAEICESSAERST